MALAVPLQDDLQHQQERLAALQPEPIKEETLADSLSSTAASVSECVSGFFRSLLYRVAVACLPCWELLTALRHVSLRSSAAASGKANGAAEAAALASEGEDGCAVVGNRRHGGGGGSDSVTLLAEGGKDYGSANGGGGGHSTVRRRALL